MSFSGWIATVAGWYVTEIGRQPFIVHGLLRTQEVAAHNPSSMIAASLAGYATVYLALLVAYVAAIKRMAEKRPADAPAHLGQDDPHPGGASHGAGIPVISRTFA